MTSTRRPRRGRASSPNWYEPADFFVLRAPLLPVEAYRRLGDGELRAAASEERVERALAVGSDRFLDALGSTAGDDVGGAKVDGALLRYLIRMSTRPTPFGLFAGVAVGAWGERTELELSTEPRPQRTRPDMAWLLHVVQAAEADPAIRSHLQVVANRAALVRAGRVFLAERVSRGEAPTPPAVSIRATGAVRGALAAARRPIRYDALAAVVLEQMPGATEEQVDRLLTQLWEQTLLLTDLRPPLTAAHPAEHVIERLAGIPAAEDLRSSVQAVLVAAADWDRPAGPGVAGYRDLVRRIRAVAPTDRAPVQVDAAVGLTHDTLSRRVGEEAARAAELLLRLSPLPRGPAHLVTYRRQFEQRYGAHREVPLLELLDPNFGLGPPGYGQPAGDAGVPAAVARRSQALLELAVTAQREHRRSVTLDDAMLDRLSSWEPAPAAAPVSLELNVLVAAASAEAVDAGDFQLVVGPNVGAMAAGRGLGRFTDVVPGAEAALRRVAAAEEALEPDRLWVEMSYQPRALRLGNVSTRASPRRHELVVGVTPGVGWDQSVPLDELVVGLRGGRFVVRWPADGRELAITAGHMLTPMRAPAVCRFLSEVGRDGSCQLAGFPWGAAAGLAFLPRVEVGRIVLAVAQWRLAAAAVGELALADPVAFGGWLDGWRASWDVPQHVYVSAGDNRLLLDLGAAGHVGELHRMLARPGAERAVVLSEVLPALDEAWVHDAHQRPFMTELVVPLVRRSGPVGEARAPSTGRTWPVTPVVHPPGGEWLFVKLYGGQDLEDDLLAGPLRTLAEAAGADGLAEQWFFLRYSDPGRHLRLRFRGRPERLLGELLPLVCAWATDQIRDGALTRFVIDTYEPETERFGGEPATMAAEQLFSADSRAVVELLALERAAALPFARLATAALTVDALLDGMGLTADARVAWCRQHGSSGPATGQDYRQWSGPLRAALTVPAQLLGPDGPALDAVLAPWCAAGAGYREAVDRLASADVLTRSLDEVLPSLVHLHLNRLLGTDSNAERRVLGLLGRVLDGLDRSGVRPRSLAERR